VFTPSKRELTPETSLGFAVVEFAEEVLGVGLLPWQRFLFVHALEIEGSFGSEWTFRFRTVLVLVARQQGKTMMSEVLALFFMYALGVNLVIGTSTNLDAAEEVWDGVVDIAESNDELAAEIEDVKRSSGRKTITLSGRRRYRITAANRKGARGKSGDLILLDELREHQDFSAWSAVTKTTMARPNALVWCMSNAGDGTSVVLRNLRMKAHARVGDPDGINRALGESAIAAEELEDLDDDTLGIFEWSAHPGASITDRDEWALANPSLGYGFVTERSLASACATDPRDEFMTECLCQWITSTVDPPFPIGSWDAGKDESSNIAPDAALWWGVDVSADRTHASIAVCGKRPDGEWHAELAAYRGGTGWVVGWLQDAAPNYPEGMKVALQSRGSPVASLMDVIAAIEGVTIVECAGKDVAGWSGRLWDAVAACDEQSDSDATPIRHRTQPALDLAANIAATRPMGDGAWAFDRAKSMEDISPLVAVCMAYGAATATEVDKHAPIPSVYEERGVLVV
jgi:phage terminase large subunit-like protein